MYDAVQLKIISSATLFNIPWKMLSSGVLACQAVKTNHKQSSNILLPYKKGECFGVILISLYEVCPFLYIIRLPDQVII